MSILVINKVLHDSEERLASRLVLLALADAAADDGITYLSQVKIAERARLSREHVSRLVPALAEDGAIEIRKAQIGRRRINVYRLILPGLKEPNYDELPFDLDAPFTVRHPAARSRRRRDKSTGDGVTSTQRRCDKSDENGSSDLIGLPVKDPSRDPGPQQLTSYFVDLAALRGVVLPKRTVGQYAQAVGKLVEEGVSADEIRAGTVRMLDRRIVQPSLLANFVAEAKLPEPKTRQQSLLDFIQEGGHD